MSKWFKRIPFEKRTDRVKAHNQFFDIGTQLESERFFPAFIGAKISHKFNDAPHSLRQLISRHNEDIYFYCVPFTKQGDRQNKILNRTGQIQKIPVTKDIMKCLFMNRQFMKPVLNRPCRILILVSRKNKPIKNKDRKMLYDTISSQHFVLGEISYKMLRKKAEANRITKGIK